MNACDGTTASRKFVCVTIAVAAVLAMVGVLGMSSFARADVLTVIGHTGNPTGQHPDVAQAAGGSLIGDRTVKYVWTYEQLWPTVGTMKLDDSIDASIPLVITAIKNEPDPDNRIMGESQGAVDVGEVYNYFVDHPDEAPAGSKLSFVFLASPVTPNGGVLSRFPGVSIPFLGISYRRPTMDSQYSVVDSHWAYDMFSSAPMYLNNPLAWYNAFCGVYRTDASSLHGVDPDYTNPNYEVHTTVVGNTTYHVLVPQHLPMYQPLVDHGYGGLVAVVEPLTKVWVNAGYWKNDPTADPGTYHPAQPFMPADNIVRAALQSPKAIAQGLATIPGTIKQALAPHLATAPVTIQNQDKPATTEAVKPQAVPSPAMHSPAEKPASVDPVSATVGSEKSGDSTAPTKPVTAKKPKPGTIKMPKPISRIASAIKSGLTPKPVTVKPGRGPSMTKPSGDSRPAASKPTHRPARHGAAPGR